MGTMYSRKSRSLYRSNITVLEVSPIYKIPPFSSLQFNINLLILASISCSSSSPQISLLHIIESSIIPPIGSPFVTRKARSAHHGTFILLVPRLALVYASYIRVFDNNKTFSAVVIYES